MAVVVVVVLVVLVLVVVGSFDMIICCWLSS